MLLFQHVGQSPCQLILERVHSTLRETEVTAVSGVSETEAVVAVQNWRAPVPGIV